MLGEVAGIGFVLVAVMFIGTLAYWFKQPLIPSYIVAGILVGPHVLRLVHEPSAIANLSDLTIILVMFVIGLEMDLRRIKAVGPVVSIGGVLQVVLTACLGTIIGMVWFPPIQALYIGLVFAFGSTTLVVKLLSDKKELDTFHGRIALGILLLQDVMAILVLSLLATKEFSGAMVLGMVIKTFGLISIAILSGHYLLPKLFRKLAESTEIMTVFSLGLAFTYVFIAESQGLSGSIGAFVVGVSLANLPYSLELIGRMKGLRDFFIPLFFGAIGLQMTIPEATLVVPIIVLFVATMTLKPMLISIITARFGYQRKTCFLVGNALLPISEFGLVIVAVGIKLGHIGQNIMTISLVIMILSMLSSSYLFGDTVYARVSPYLKFLDKIGPAKRLEETEDPAVRKPIDVLLVGCHRVGRSVIDKYHPDHRICVIEQDPSRIEKLRSLGVPCIYGDCAEPEIWERIDMSEIKLVISTMPGRVDNEEFISFIRGKYPACYVLIFCESADDIDALYAAGADHVTCPMVKTSIEVTIGALDCFNFDALKEQRENDEVHLKNNRVKWESP